MTVDDYASLIPDLERNGLEHHGTCPTCSKPSFRVRVYGTNDIEGFCLNGCKVARNGQAPKPPPGQSPGKFRLLTRDELRRQPSPEWLFGNIMTSQGFVVIYGKSNAAKTFFALDACLSTVKPGEWCGHQVKGGPVVYVNADSGGGLKDRLLAWEEAHGEEARHEFYILNERVALCNASEVQGFAKALSSLPEAPSLIVIDTLARCFDGNENDADSMGRFIAGIDHLRQKLGSTVIVVHHVGKAGEAERGSSALRAAADTMISVERSGLDVRVKCDKQRDAAPFDDMHFQLRSLGNSAILVRSNAPEGDVFEEAMETQLRHKVLELLALQPAGATQDELELQANRPARDSVLYKAIRGLIADGKVEGKEDHLSFGRGRRPKRYRLITATTGELDGMPAD